tara:strand:- start:168 stop:425 length:258 start_codon:yes stop_codon:yes gene_type:complete
VSDGYANRPTLNKCELLIASALIAKGVNKADSFYMARGTYALAQATEFKVMPLIEGSTHIETYWKPDYVEQAMVKLSSFFIDTLR